LWVICRKNGRPDEARVYRIAGARHFIELHTVQDRATAKARPNGGQSRPSLTLMLGTNHSPRMRLARVARKEAVRTRFFVTNLGRADRSYSDTLGLPIQPDINWLRPFKGPPRFRSNRWFSERPTGICKHGRLSLSPVGRGRELSLSGGSRTEPMHIRKNNLGSTDAGRKKLTATKLTRKEAVLRLQATWRVFQKRKRQCNPTETRPRIETTDQMPPANKQQIFTPRPSPKQTEVLESTCRPP